MVSAEPAPRRVAIVDDSRVVRELVQSVLERAGMTTCVLSDAFGEDDTLRAFEPHIVLLDVGMSGVGEQGIRERVATFRALTGARIVLHSGREPDELAVLGERAGADGVLCKSGDIDAIVRTVSEG